MATVADAISQILGQGFSGSSDQIDKLAQALGVTAEQAANALRQIQQFNSVKLGFSEQFDKLNNELGITVDQFKGLSQAATALGGSADGFDKLGKSIEGTSKQGNLLTRAFQGFHELVAENEIVKTAFAFNQVTGAIGELEHLARPVFEGLIAQNIELRQQILSVSATLAATQQVKVDGETATKPIEAIKAAGTAVSEQLNVLRTDSLSLAGVTSTELVGSFQAIAQASGGLGLNLKQAEKTTIALTAASTTLGLTEFQRSQEIQSIARGEVTTYNQLAKSLGITNEIVRQKAAEGKLYEFIQTKTEALREAQGLAAQSFAGVTSNLKEIVQLTTQAAGAPLLDLLLKELNQFYEFIKEKQEALQNFSVAAVTAILDVVNPIITALQPAIDSLGAALGNTAVALLAAFQNLTPIFIQVGTAIAAIVVEASQLVVVFSEFLKVIGDLLSPTTALALAVGALAIATALYRTELLALIATNVVGFFTNFASNIALLGSAMEGMKLEIIGGRFLALSKAITTAMSAAKAGGFAGLIAELGPLAIAAAAVAAPLIAIAGAIALTGLVKYTQDLRVSNDELEQFGQQTNKVGEDSIALAFKLKNAKNKSDEAKKSGVALTKEELEANKKLLSQGKGQVEAIDSEIDSLKKLKVVGDEGRANQASQIKQLEKLKETLGGLSSDVTFDNKPLVERGNEFEQLTNRIKAYKKTVDSPVDQAKFDEASKGIIPLIKEAVEAGTISATQAEDQLNQLASDRRADFETQKLAIDAITKVRKDALDLEKTDVEGQIAEVSEAVASGRTGDAEGAKETTALKRIELNNQLNDTRSAILAEESAIAEGRGSETKLKQLKQQEKTGQTDLAKNAKEGRDHENQERLKDFDEGQKELDGKKAQGLITEQAFADKSLGISQNRLSEELRQIATKRKALDPKDKEGNEALDAQEAEIRKKQVDVVQKYGEQKIALLRDQSKLESSLLEANKSQGLISETQYADGLLQLTQTRLAKELELIAEQRSRIPKGNTEALRKLAIEEADIRKQQVDAIEKFESEKIAILDRSQKKALDLVKEAETESEIATQKLLNKREIREAEASDRNLKEKRKLLEEELKLETEKTAAIAALPKLTDEAKEEERQTKIRASRQRTGELTLQLLQNEREQQESTFKVISDKIDQQLKATTNYYTEQEQGLQRISTAQDYLVKNLERQNTLLSAQKDLQSAISGYIDGEYKIAESLLTNEYQKRTLREEAARSRLAFLDREQELERQSLDLEQAKNKALLDREIIQNRIAQSKSEAGLAKSIAEQAKTKADPKATAADKNAADLSVKASQDEVIGTRFQGRLLEDQGAQQAGLDAAKRRSLAVSQDLKRDQARADLAKETRGRGDDLEIANQSADKARNAAQYGDATVSVSATKAGNYDDFYRTELAKLRGGGVQQRINAVVNPTQAAIPQGFGVQQSLPSGTSQAVAASEGGLTGLRAAIGDAIVQGFAKLGRLGNVNQTNSITNNLNGADIANGKAADTVSQQILNQLYDVGRLAKAKTANT